VADGVLLGLGLYDGDGDGVDDVTHTASPAQVVNGFVESLQHGAGGRWSRHGPLYGFVCVVAGIQVGEDEDRGMTGHIRVRRLGAGDLRVHCGVVLQRSLDGQVQMAFFGKPAGDARRLCHFFDLGAGAGFAYLLIAFLKFKSKIGWPLQEMIQLLQLNVFNCTDLEAFFKPPDEMSKIKESYPLLGLAS